MWGNIERIERKYKVCNFGLKQRREVHWSLKRRGEVRWSLKQTCHVFSGRRSNTHKGSPPQKKDMCKLSDCIPTSHTLPSKNKNINYIFIYRRVLCCLSSGAIYYNSRFCWNKRFLQVQHISYSLDQVQPFPKLNIHLKDIR